MISTHHPAIEHRDPRVDWHLFWQWVAYLAVITATPLVMLIGGLLVESAGR